MKSFERIEGRCPICGRAGTLEYCHFTKYDTHRIKCTACGCDYGAWSQVDVLKVAGLQRLKKSTGVNNETI